MDDETKVAFAETRAEMRAAFAETRAEFAEMRAETESAFVRIDRYFELNQLQIAELREEVQGVRNELRNLRDWAETGFARLRTELVALRSWAEDRFAEVRSGVHRLGARIDQLEQRRDDTHV